MVNTGTKWVYEYFLQDHLGSIRVAFFVDTVRAVHNQYNHYYPLGLQITTGNSGVSDNLYRYNGKELQHDS